MNGARYALVLLALARCSAPDAAPLSPEDMAFAALPAGATVELVPTTAAATTRCAAELGATYCAPAAALAAARACRARLTADERAACDATRGCVVPYAPTRPGACMAGITYASRAACAAPVADNCAFYRACLDAAHPCGDAGYALGFGERLCYVFIERREEFTPEGQRWLRGVRTCLQASLATLAARPAMTCDTLADEAYASHTRCYTETDNSFCTLPPADVLRLATLLGPYFRDPRVAAQTRAVAEICAARSP